LERIKIFKYYGNKPLQEVENCARIKIALRQAVIKTTIVLNKIVIFGELNPKKYNLIKERKYLI
jgi:hypothetical protein